MDWRDFLTAMQPAVLNQQDRQAMYPYLGMVPGPIGVGSQVAQNVEEQGLAKGLLGSAATMATPALVRGMLGKAAGQAAGYAARHANKSDDSDTSYRGMHRAPMKSEGAPLHDVTKLYPDDIYGPMGARYYGDMGGDAMDSASVNIIQRYKGKPDAMVTAYRAVPEGTQKQIERLEKQLSAYLKRRIVPKEFGGSRTSIGDEQGFYDWATSELARLKSLPAGKQTINNGDWVTINRQYAKQHGESNLGGKYEIISKKVPARKLFTEANSVHEFGYDESGRIDPILAAALGIGSAGLLGYANMEER